MTAGASATENGTMLLEAARAGDAAKVESLIASGAPLEARDEAKRTALLIATRANNIDAARALIAAGADVNAKDDIRDTPYLYAGAQGRIEILKAILATGKADLKDTNRYGGTALIPAAEKGHPEAVRMLIEAGVDIDHVNNLGWTALLEAVVLSEGGPIHQEIVGLLVDAGARNIPDRDGVTPLQHAQARGFAEISERIAAGKR
ncbi:MAG TPA: ankyrin repeat domain-containing protein [Rhizobiaceae bacterium]|nr:ankyrin repeat domain-containing protein [Rhizobiaceae bacterium]